MQKPANQALCSKERNRRKAYLREKKQGEKAIEKKKGRRTARQKMVNKAQSQHLATQQMALSITNIGDSNHRVKFRVTLLL